jgi:hypothetical protein
LVAGRITFKEYCYNVMLAMVSVSDEDMPRSVEIVPPDVVTAYTDYLRTALEPVDFMPCPKPFLAGGDSEEVIERKERELRPKYFRLYQLMRERGS